MNKEAQRALIMDIQILRTALYDIEKTVMALVEFLDVEIVDIPYQVSRKRAMRRDSGKAGG